VDILGGRVFTSLLKTRSVANAELEQLEASVLGSCWDVSHGGTMSESDFNHAETPCPRRCPLPQGHASTCQVRRYRRLGKMATDFAVVFQKKFHSSVLLGLRSVQAHASAVLA